MAVLTHHGELALAALGQRMLLNVIAKLICVEVVNQDQGSELRPLHEVRSSVNGFIPTAAIRLSNVHG